MAVDLEPHAKVLRIGDFVPGHKPRPDRPERIGRLAFDPLPGPLGLEFAFGHIVDHAIARHVIERIGEAHACRLDQVMIRVGRLETHTSNVETLGNIERHKGCDSVAVWWAFPHVNAAVFGVDRHIPVGVMCRHVLFRDPTAFGLYKVG